MSKFTALEQAVLQEVCQQHSASRAILEAQLATATNIRRDNTGVGFYTNFQVSREVAPLAVSEKRLGLVWATIDGFEDPMTFVLFVEDGYANCLEGAAVRDKTTGFDFAAATFRLISR